MEFHLRVMQLSAGWNYIYIAAGSRVRALQPSIECKIRYGVCPNKITPRSRSLLPPPRRLFSTSRASARVETFRARMRDRTYVRTREIENYNFRDGERKFGARNCTPLHRVGEVSRDRYSEHLLTDRYGPRVVPKLRFSRSVAKFSAPSNENPRNFACINGWSVKFAPNVSSNVELSMILMIRIRWFYFVWDIE